MRSEPYVVANGQMVGQFGRYTIIDSLGMGAVAEAIADARRKVESLHSKY